MARAKPLLLINGDLLSVRSAGAASIASLTAQPDPDPLWPLSTGSGTYEFPVDAIPYLGHGLEARLFNVTLLRRVEAGGRLPVRLSYGGAVPSVPGITITRSGDGVAAGYLTAASAAAFGRALERQFAAGHARGNYAAGLFGGVDIALAGAKIPVPVRPQFPMHTLTVTATNERGKADNGDEVLLLNADNVETFGDPNEVFNNFYHGSTKYSVPAGHYWALVDFATVNKGILSQRLVVLPQFTVSGNGTTVHFAASAATSEFTFSTPRPATTKFMDWTIVRSNRQGPPAVTGTISFDTPTWISPTKARPSVGSLASYTQAQLFSAAKVKGTPYEYNLDFSGPPGVVPAQHYVVTSANVATVHEKIYDNAKSTASITTAGGNLAQLSQLAQTTRLFAPAVLEVPGEQTEYMSGGPSYAWETGVSTSNDIVQDDTFHTLPVGQNFTENWNRYPLHPQLNQVLLTGKLGDLFREVPAAYRIGKEIWFSPIPFSDNDYQFGHTSEISSTGTYRIVDNGRRVAGGGFEDGEGRAEVPPTPSTVSFSMSVVQAPNPLTALSRSTYTVWTMRTTAQPGAKVPPSWECLTISGGTTRHCTVPSMLTLNYQVRDLGLDGVAPAGPQRISVSVGHIQLSKPSAVVSAKARVSWDDGRFWYPATVTKTSPGNYQVTFTPPPGVDVTLKFTARDAAGGSVSETITEAYAIGPSA